MMVSLYSIIFRVRNRAEVYANLEKPIIIGKGYMPHGFSKDRKMYYCLEKPFDSFVHTFWIYPKGVWYIWDKVSNSQNAMLLNGPNYTYYTSLFFDNKMLEYGFNWMEELKRKGFDTKYLSMIWNEKLSEKSLLNSLGF